MKVEAVYDGYGQWSDNARRVYRDEPHSSNLNLNKRIRYYPECKRVQFLSHCNDCISS